MRRNLIVRCKALEGKIAAERELYEKLDGKSTRADLVFRHMRALEKAIAQCQAYSYHVDSILLNLSEQETMIQVVDALQEGKKATVQLDALLRVEDIEELLEDGLSAREKRKALEDCLSQDIGYDSSVARIETPVSSDQEILPHVPKLGVIHLGSSEGVKEQGLNREGKRVLTAS